MAAVGVRCRPRRIYYFDPAGLELKIGERVIVETERGLEMGEVVKFREGVEGVKPVLRRAEPEEEERARQFQEKEKEALAQARQAASRLGVPIKIVGAEYSWDGRRMSIYFTAPGRVDFRPLVKELASQWQTRVEMRQLGARDEVQLMGGMGPCGLPTCCSRWLTRFVPISLRMAKDQELPLHPEKLSGRCGRLLCCLAYELELYRQLQEGMPPLRQRVATPLGVATVVARHPLKETVTVELESQATAELPLSQVSPL